MLRTDLTLVLYASAVRFEQKTSLDLLSFIFLLYQVKEGYWRVFSF
jgi:hypothetical protein